jgi:hypothetical protein
MPTIKVLKRFLLKDEKDQLTEYLPGDYDVSDEIANHWYVVAHCEGYQAPPPPMGTAQYAAAELRVAQAARIGAPPGTVTQRPPEPGSPVNFAGRALPQTPNQLPGFTDPRTLDPREIRARAIGEQ